MRPTKPATLIVAALAAGALAWVLVGHYYSDFPNIPWLPAVTLLVLAIGEAVVARVTKGRIDRRPGAAPVDPLAIARYVVLAKASSLAGALFAGFNAGLLIWLLVSGNQLSQASRDVPPTVAGLVAAVLLVAAALWLEHSCRVPRPPKDDESGE
jgi:hypothetical protein